MTEFNRTEIDEIIKKYFSGNLIEINHVHTGVLWTTTKDSIGCVVISFDFLTKLIMWKAVYIDKHGKYCKKTKTIKSFDIALSNWDNHFKLFK